MKRILALAVAALLFSSAAADARSVTVTGSGISQNEAESDALRNAVEKAVGVLVDSQTMVSSNTILQDEIYTQSRGFVTNYNVTDRQPDGNGWRVTVNADVDDSPNSPDSASLIPSSEIPKSLSISQSITSSTASQIRRERPRSSRHWLKLVLRMSLLPVRRPFSSMKTVSLGFGSRLSK